MENNEILIKILETLKIEQIDFQNSIIIGRMIQTGIELAFTIIFLFIFLYLVKLYNSEFYIKDNIINILDVMKDYNGRKDNKKVEDSLNVSIESIFEEIKRFLNGHFFWRTIITIISLWIEISVFFSILSNIINKIIILINCYYAPQKVIIDYLSTLF